MSTRETADVVVVGAGITGLWAAIEIAEAGWRVVVLEKGDFWREGSAANAGTLALQNKPIHLLAAYREALGLWDSMAGCLNADFGRVRRGGLRVAETETDLAALRAAMEEQATAGVQVEWLDSNRLRALAPFLGRSVAAATYCAEDGFASPLLVGQALLSAARARGVVVRDRCALREARRRRGGYLLDTQGGQIDSPAVLLATGPWTETAARLFGLRLHVPVQVNMLTVTDRIAQFMGNLVVTHVRGRFTLKQFANGSCILGGGFRGVGDPESGTKELDLEQLRANWRFQCAVVPHLRQATVLRSWTGFTAAPSDSIPAIGPVPDCPGLHVAVTTGAGFTIGPLAGRIAAESVLSGRQPDRWLAFAPYRLCRRAA